MGPSGLGGAGHSRKEERMHKGPERAPGPVAVSLSLSVLSRESLRYSFEDSRLGVH